ncbi:N-terminal divergent BTB domain-containing protein [Acanthamoeba polyphaga mimivirus]|uniref:N-terminal divergent BTB domain-containing protein n=1 Tax=Acanthamoeba polyphaga mimivirus Kroon TaxID=3069720 RepID=A0A0G2Y2F9_9VIRU|nr:N-terminal divergent BTB domain-containing protein [Acanthamoeba polyphaga mimivirus]AKI79955.1 N-terminal divergent BTB domain-containing protein [Acanthamoeba polyphaga mimivirus Kroon]
MNYDKLFQNVLNNKLTDLELVLTDPENNNLVLNLHKIILDINCPYFETLFSNNFIDSNRKNLNLFVEDSYITRDIIYSFYDQTNRSTNYPDWLYQLKKIKCQNFLCMKPDFDGLLNLVFNKNNFDELLNTIDSIGYNDKLVSLIFKNMPIDYDLAKFPVELLNRMLDVSGFYIMYYDNNRFSMYNQYCEFVIFDGINDFDHDLNSEIVYVPNSQEIVYVSKEIVVFNIETQTSRIADNVNPNFRIRCLTLYPDQEHIIYFNSICNAICKFNIKTMKMVGIWCLSTGREINVNKIYEGVYYFNSERCKIVLSPSGDKFVFITDGINCYDANTMKVSWRFNKIVPSSEVDFGYPPLYCIGDVMYSSCGKYIFYLTKFGLFVINSSNGHLISEMKVKGISMCHITENIIAILTYDSIGILMYDYQNNMIVSEINFEDDFCFDIKSMVCMNYFDGKLFVIDNTNRIHYYYYTNTSRIYHNYIINIDPTMYEKNFVEEFEYIYKTYCIRDNDIIKYVNRYYNYFNIITDFKSVLRDKIKNRIKSFN